MARSKPIVRGRQTTNTFCFLKQAAEHLLQLAKQNKAGSAYTSMMALVATAFMLEAFLNHLGAELCPIFWESNERSLSPRQKLDAIASYLKFKPDFSRRPFQSFTALFEFRNQLAHGKTEKIEKVFHSGASHTRDSLQLADDSSKVLSPRWLRMCKPEEAERRLNDADKIVKDLWGRTRHSGDPCGVMTKGEIEETL